MEHLIYLTDNLLANLLQKLKETKDELLSEIKREGQRLEGVVHALRQEILGANTQTLPNAATLTSNLKLLGFDFHFMKERLAQIQRSFDSRMSDVEQQQSQLNKQWDECHTALATVNRVRLAADRESGQHIGGTVWPHRTGSDGRPHRLTRDPTPAITPFGSSRETNFRG